MVVMTGFILIMRLSTVMLGCGVYCAWLLKININYGDVRFLNCLYMGLYGAVEQLSTDVVYSGPAARNIPLNHGLNHGLTYNLLFSL